MFDLFIPKLTILDPFEIICTHLDQFVPILIVALIVNFVHFLLIFNLILLYFISVYSDFVKPESSLLDIVKNTIERFICLYLKVLVEALAKFQFLTICCFLCVVLK